MLINDVLLDTNLNKMTELKHGIVESSFSLLVYSGRSLTAQETQSYSFTVLVPIVTLANQYSLCCLHATIDSLTEKECTEYVRNLSW